MSWFKTSSVLGSISQRIRVGSLRLKPMTNIIIHFTRYLTITIHRPMHGPACPSTKSPIPWLATCRHRDYMIRLLKFWQKLAFNTVIVLTEVTNPISGDLMSDHSKSRLDIKFQMFWFSKGRAMAIPIPMVPILDFEWSCFQMVATPDHFENQTI